MLQLIAAILLAAMGGRWFISALDACARHWRLPTWWLAGSLGAAATSAPELGVAWIAALEGRPEVGLGDSFGSNVVNLTLILGLGWLGVRRPAPTGDGAARRLRTLALLAPALTLALLVDGGLSRSDGVVLLCTFAWGIWWESRHRPQVEDDAIRPAKALVQRPRLHPLAALLGSLALLLVAGQWFVAATMTLAQQWQLPTYGIASVLVALGTSLPELSAVLVARWQGRDDLGLGLLLGSNLFNGLVIVGSASLMAPSTVSFGAATVALLAGGLGVAMATTGTTCARWRRWQAVALLLVYAIYLGVSAFSMRHVPA